MLDYLRQVVYRYLNERNGRRVMNSFRAYFLDEVNDFMRDINYKGKAMLPGHVAESQPCAIVVNKPFKKYMIDEWNAFISEPTTEDDFIKGFNRKRVSYERILSIVSKSLVRLNRDPEMIRKALT